MHQNSELTDRQKAFLLVSFLTEKDGAKDLIATLSASEQGAMGRALEELKTAGSQGTVLTDELKRLALDSKKSPLADIHPDWLLQALQKESPRTIATILRHLPGQHVSHILAGLPESLLKGMPSFSETFSLDPEVALILRRRFEQQFRERASESTSRLAGLKNFPCLKLEMLFRELGFTEAAMAFATLNEKTIGLILRRVPPRDAALLKGRLSKNQEDIQDDRTKQAQTHILSLDLEKSASNLILELGFFVASKAALPVNRGVFMVLARKFSLRDGNLLLKYVERNLPLNSEKTTQRYEAEILSAMASLEGEKK